LLTVCIYIFTKYYHTESSSRRTDKIREENEGMVSMRADNAVHYGAAASTTIAGILHLLVAYNAVGLKEITLAILFAKVALHKYSMHCPFYAAGVDLGIMQE
jgi:hypothetical protein